MATVNDRRWKVDKATGQKVRTSYDGDQPYQVQWRKYRRVDLSGSTSARDESYYTNHIEPTFAAVPLAAIDLDFLTAWIAELVRKVASRAGHASVATVFDRYGHLLPGREEGVMDASMPGRPPRRRRATCGR